MPALRPLLILASRSKRRKKILKFLSIPFQTHVAHGFDETAFAHEKASRLVRRLSIGKAQLVAKRYPHSPVLAADTVVVWKGEIFGKPRNREEAFRMLMSLQGTGHEVWTGATLIWDQKRIQDTHVEKTSVFFQPLSEPEVEKYVKTKEPYDKAGGYDIQSTAFKWVQRWEGDYFNVMGLPLVWTIGQIKRINCLNKS